MQFDWHALGSAAANTSLLVLGVSLGALLLAESLLPRGALLPERARIAHLGRNLSLWLMGTLVIQLGIDPAFLDFAKTLAQPTWGVSSLGLAQWQVFLIGVIIFDLVAYWDHRISHHFKPLWALHAVHHSDADVDTTTAIRAHPLEAVVSIFVSFGILYGFGIPVWVYFLRSALMAPLALFHHANVEFPERIDRVMRWVLVSPRMHRIHHSDREQETNSNYGHMFTWWDRIFGTYCDPAQTKESELRFGLTALRDAPMQTLWGALRTPVFVWGRDRV